MRIQNVKRKIKETCGRVLDIIMAISMGMIVLYTTAFIFVFVPILVALFFIGACLSFFIRIFWRENAILHNKHPGNNGGTLFIVDSGEGIRQITVEEKDDEDVCQHQSIH